MKFHLFDTSERPRDQGALVGVEPLLFLSPWTSLRSNKVNSDSRSTFQRRGGIPETEAKLGEEVARF